MLNSFLQICLYSLGPLVAVSLVVRHRYRRRIIKFVEIPAESLVANGESVHVQSDEIAPSSVEASNFGSESGAGEGTVAELELFINAPPPEKSIELSGNIEKVDKHESEVDNIPVPFLGHLPGAKETFEKATLSIKNPERGEIRKTQTPYLEHQEMEVRVIKSIPDPSKSEPKRIGYAPNYVFAQKEPGNFALVKMPLVNSLIKFPRKGRSNKKGFKEDEFKVFLEQYFSGQFNVIDDRHVPTASGRPYEPDFVLSNEKDGKNIFINVEIDEPYDGLLRTPTHCVSDNTHRDEFFSKRGWIVIRFAEIQVHENPRECCAFVARVIQSIDPSYDSNLLNIKELNPVPRWGSLQAKRWAFERYRENYLGIDGFGSRANIITEYEITDSEADNAVEMEAPKAEPKKAVAPLFQDRLKSKNGKTRDGRVTFDPEEHRYFIDGNPDTISVTQLTDKFFPEFDGPYWANVKAKERGVSEEVVLGEWESKRDTAARKGTELHEAIEFHYNDNSHKIPTKEFQFFMDFKERYNTMLPYRTEWRVFDEDLLVAGTIDMAYKKEDGSVFLFDWKRSEKVLNKNGTVKENTYQTAMGELSHLGDSSYSRYCLQQNIYKAILEKRYAQKVTSMNLLVLHEAYDRFHIVQIPEMQKEVSHILRHALLLK